MMPPWEGPPMERHSSRLSRREFVEGASTVGLLAGCGRLPWQAQAPRVPRIGMLGAPNEGVRQGMNEAFAQGLHELGYVEGQNILVERRYAAQALALSV